MAIEPIPSYSNYFFQTSNIDLVRCVIFKECREVAFNVTSDLYSSSLLYKGNHEITVSGRTLECICKELEIENGKIFLKTDLQGFDFDAFLSMGRYLSQVSLVQMECQLSAYTIGMVGLSERILQMSEYGFQVIDIFNLMDRPSDGMLGQVDILFEKISSDTTNKVAW